MEIHLVESNTSIALRGHLNAMITPRHQLIPIPPINQEDDGDLKVCPTLVPNEFIYSIDEDFEIVAAGP